MRCRSTLALAFLAGLATVVALAGCGAAAGGDATHPDYAKALAGSPAPLARLHAEANKLLPGGKDAYEARVAALGYPVVANVWASWCAPCLYEFPLFQQAAARWGKKVAFLGVDSEDSESHARAWLAEHPVPYPSYFETGAEIPAALKVTTRPDTAFYDRQGELVYVKRGQYAHLADLEADIRRYALGGA